MARIGTQRHTAKAPAQPRPLAQVSEPIWLALGLGGLVVAIAAPAEASWLVQPSAVVVSGVGLYGLGRAHGQARPDPAARSRVSHLERTLTQLAVLVGYDGLAGRPDRSAAGATAEGPDEDAGAASQQRSRPTGGRPGVSADDVGLAEGGG